MQIFKRLFEDGLDIQKQRIREVREYAKEKREALAQKQQNEIESLENLYPLSRIVPSATMSCKNVDTLCAKESFTEVLKWMANKKFVRE